MTDTSKSFSKSEWIEAFRNTLIAHLPRPPKRLVHPSCPYRLYRGCLVYHANGKMYKVAECERDRELMFEMLLEYRKEREKQ